jgi:hypothetical protein
LGNRLNSQSEKERPCSPQSNLRRADLLTVAQSAVTSTAFGGAILHLLQWSKNDELQTYIGTPHR